MARRSLFKKVLSVSLATAMAVSGFVYNPVVVKAAETTTTVTENAPLATIVKTANVGTCTGGSYVQTKDHAFEITGAGTIFDKDKGHDDYSYVYFDAQGNITVTAKLTPGADNKGGMVGVIARNDLESEGQAAGVYFDYGKGTVRNGRHGGAGTLAKIADIPASIYVKLEISPGSVYITTAKDAAFTEIISARNGMGVTGLEAKNVGFFATEGNTLTVSDLLIKAEYTDSLGRGVKKVVYDSEIGEMIPTFSKSDEYAGVYEAVTTTTVDGNKLTVNSVKAGSNKGDMRAGKSVDYLLFPATTKNLTVSADMEIIKLDNGTDKHGAAVGQFAANDSKVAGSSNMAVSFLQYNKNGVTQMNYTKAENGDNGGDPKSSSGSIVAGKSYNLEYAKKDDETTTLTTKDASGAVLATGDIDLSAQHASLGYGQPVQYGVSFCITEVVVTNLTLKDSEGWILYDMNDYYVAKGVAPEVTEATATIANDRLTIGLDWKATEGQGSFGYVVLVSKDGGEYELVGTANTEAFTFTPSGSAKYTFKVYGQAGEDSTEDKAAVTSEVNYVAPLTKPALEIKTAGTKATITWKALEDADTFYLYKTDSNKMEATLVKKFDSTVTSYTDTLDALDTAYYHMVTEDSKTGNTSNPSRDYIAVANTDRTSLDYLYGDEAAVITITEKSNDTVTGDTVTIKGTVNKAGTINVESSVAGSGTEVAANGTFEFTVPVEAGRNDVTLYFFEKGEDKKCTRKSFSFYKLDKYDILVDATATADGTTVFNKVSEAFAAVKAGQTIFIKNGNYEERVELNTPNVTIIGEDSEKTRVFASVAMADKTATGMWDRNAFYVGADADGLVMENFTIENSYAYKNGNNEQADALAIVATDVTCVNLRLIGYQDTLLVDSRVSKDGKYEQTKQYFYKCYITGNVDFIYGSGSAIFDDCDIVGRYTSYKADGCFTAARTYDYIPYGLVFINSRFTAEDGVKAGQYRLARPWGADAHTQFIACYISDVVAGAGYGDMSGNAYTNARFAEYLTFGPGFVVDNDRINLSNNEAEALLKIYATDYAYIEAQGLKVATPIAVGVAAAEETKLNGLYRVDGVWGYYVDGDLDTTKTGLVYYGTDWWYVKNGLLDKTATGLTYANGAWRYVKDGKLDKTYKGLAYANGDWWYVENGTINKEATGLVWYGSQWWYVANGKLDKTYRGLVYANGNWWAVENGTINKDITSLVWAGDAWYYVKSGKLDKTYTGLVSYASKLWYVANGKLDKTFAGTVSYEGKSYVVANGVGTAK